MSAAAGDISARISLPTWRLCHRGNAVKMRPEINNKFRFLKIPSAATSKQVEEPLYELILHMLPKWIEVLLRYLSKYR